MPQLSADHASHAQQVFIHCVACLCVIKLAQIGEIVRGVPHLGQDMFNASVTIVVQPQAQPPSLVVVAVCFLGVQ